MFAFPTIAVRLLAEVLVGVVAVTLVIRVDRRGGLGVAAVAAATVLAEIGVPAVEMGGIFLLFGNLGANPAPPTAGSMGGMFALLALELLPPLAHATLLVACAWTLARVARRAPPEHGGGGAGTGW